jgi:hypothetical protein
MKNFVFVLCFFFAICLLTGIGACRKTALSPAGDLPDTTYSQLFGDFWTKMNTNYLYWDIDTTDWERVYRTYRPLFSQLDMHVAADAARAAGYFNTMTAGLTDGHYSITYGGGLFPPTTVIPSLDRKERTAGWHIAYPYLILDTAYLDSGSVYGSYINQDRQRISAACGFIGGNILYFGCDHFGLGQAYKAETPNGVKQALTSFFSFLQIKGSSTRAIILDVRNNPGGDVSDLNFLLGRMITRKKTFGYTKYKSGSGRLDYTPWIIAELEPQPGGVAPAAPLIVLADSYSASLAEAFVMAVKTLPNATFIGETTWGATGPLTTNALYNDGSFTVSSFLSVVTASAAFQYIDGKSYEGKGYPPDIPIPFDLVALNGGRDAALEKAISLSK